MLRRLTDICFIFSIFIALTFTSEAGTQLEPDSALDFDQSSALQSDEDAGLLQNQTEDSAAGEDTDTEENIEITSDGIDAATSDGIAIAKIETAVESAKIAASSAENAAASAKTSAAKAADASDEAVAASVSINAFDIICLFVGILGISAGTVSLIFYIQLKNKIKDEIEDFYSLRRKESENGEQNSKTNDIQDYTLKIQKKFSENDDRLQLHQDYIIKIRDELVSNLKSIDERLLRLEPSSGNQERTQSYSNTAGRVTQDPVTASFNNWARNPVRNLESWGYFKYADIVSEVRIKTPLRLEESSESANWIITKTDNPFYLYPNPNIIDHKNLQVFEALYDIERNGIGQRGSNVINIIKPCELDSMGQVHFKGSMTLN